MGSGKDTIGISIARFSQRLWPVHNYVEACWKLAKGAQRVGHCKKQLGVEWIIVESTRYKFWKGVVHSIKYIREIWAALRRQNLNAASSKQWHEGVFWWDSKWRELCRPYLTTNKKTSGIFPIYRSCLLSCWPWVCGTMNVQHCQWMICSWQPSPNKDWE